MVINDSSHRAKKIGIKTHMSWEILFVYGLLALLWLRALLGYFFHFGWPLIYLHFKIHLFIRSIFILKCVL
ncbi:unnamed protein product [Meloidogyne enterolobii]|uniref:Uncharacterized protein n=1 Tax=Meloidogyne enterolobii TaxID=390850 RepID=A0ACB0YMS9_MELEN